MKSLDHPNSHRLRSSSPLIFVERVLATSSITKATAMFKSATPKPNVAVPADFVVAAADDDDDESFSRRSFSLSSVVVAVSASHAAPLDEGGEERTDVYEYGISAHAGLSCNLAAANGR